MPDRLETLHRRIEDLTDPDGEYAVVCPRSGKRPVPVRGKSFPSAEVAAEAVDLVIEYRKLLREVDPYLENIPIVACAESADPLSLTATDEPAATDESTATDEPNATGRRSRERSRSRDRTGERDHAGERDRPNDRVRRDAGGSASARDPAEIVTLSGDGDGEWLRMTGAPVVRVREDGEPLDDAVIGLELNSKL